MYIIFCVLVLLSGALLLSVVFKKDLVVTIPFWVLSIILLLYMFGIFGILNIGFWFMIALCAISLALSIFIIIKKKQYDLSNLYSPGVVIYIFMMIIAISLQSRRLFTTWDEFSHWGLVIKNMYLLDAFSGHPQSKLIFYYYSSIASVFQYIFLKIYGMYSESISIAAMNILYFSLMLPVFRNTSWKNIGRILSITLFIYVLPIVFLGNFFTTIYVDILMGILFSYIITTHFLNKPSTFNIITISLAVSVLVLTKSAGQGLALIALIIILVDIIRNRRKNNNIDADNVNKSYAIISLIKSYKIFIISITSLFVSSTSWKIYMKIHNIVNTRNASSLSIKETYSLIISKNSVLVETIYNFISQIFRPFRYNINGKFTLIQLIFMFIILFIVLYKKSSSKQKKIVSFINYSLIIGFVIYLFSMLTLYITSFSNYEAIKLASFDRYISTYVVGWLSIIFHMCFSKTDTANTIIYKYYSKILLLVICCMINLYPLLEISFLSNSSIATTISLRQNYNYTLENKITVDDKLYLLHIESRGFEKLVAKYNHLSYSISGASSIGLKPYSEDDIWTEIMTADEFETYLYANNYTHLYASNVNEEFTRNYGHLFPNSQPYTGVLYRVVIDSKSKSVNLTKVE